MEELVARIRLIMEKEGYSPASFADALGVGRPLMSHVLGGRNNPSLQLVMKILEHFPAYSASWLIQGFTENRSMALNMKLPLSDHSPEELEPPAEPEKESSHRKAFPENTVSNSGVVRTMLFYADGTFEEYKPRR